MFKKHATRTYSAWDRPWKWSVVRTPPCDAPVSCRPSWTKQCQWRFILPRASFCASRAIVGYRTTRTAETRAGTAAYFRCLVLDSNHKQKWRLLRLVWMRFASVDVFAFNCPAKKTVAVITTVNVGQSIPAIILADRVRTYQ